MIRHILAICFLSLAACDFSSRTFLDDLNEPPQINFSQGEQTALSDSIKVSLKNSQEIYSIALSVYDPNNNIDQIIYSQITGRGGLYQNGDTVVNKLTYDKVTGALNFDYYPVSLGYHEFSLKAIDSFDANSTATIELVAFDNLSPVAKFTISRKGTTDRYHYVIEAEESYDRDEKFGGGVARYEFTALGKIVYTQSQTHRDIIFPQDGVYEIAVRVQDNDGRWSEKIVIPDYVVN